MNISEQPRRRRRQTEVDVKTMCEGIQSNAGSLTAIPLANADIITDKNQEISSTEQQSRVFQTETNKRRPSILCLISSAAGVVMMSSFAAMVVFDKMQRKIRLALIMYHWLDCLVVPIGLVLFIVAAFLFEAKGKQTHALIIGVVAGLLSVYQFILSVPMFSFSLEYFDFIDILHLLLPYALLIVYTIPKKKCSNIWILVGAVILLLQIAPVLLADAPIDWMGTSFGYNSIGRFEGPLPSRWGLIHVIDLLYGLVFFFGMSNVPKKKRNRTYYSCEYPLLEQYKREHGM